MQVIAAAVPASRSSRLVIARAALSAVLMVVVGALLAWAVVATPIISSLMPSGRPSPLQTAVGVFAWGFAIVVPAGFLLLGAARLLNVLDRVASARSRAISPRLAKVLDSGHLAVMDLHIPGGRRIHELVLGPYGVVVLADVPPPSISRHSGNLWELRGERGRWIPIEGPLERAARDAERVRSWLASDDRDFLVKVYAAVVTDDTRVERTPGCAVVRPGDLPGWLEALPPQRGLTPDRREHLVELMHDAARS
jgi:hypothetical protein